LPSFFVRDIVVAFGLQKMVKQGENGDKPTVLTTEPFYQRFESRVNITVPKESSPKMGVHDAGAPLFLKTILV
jgi:hypothetical protein